MIAKFKTEQLKRKVHAQAEKYRIRLIDAEKAGNVIKTAIKELRGNRVLITQCDEIEQWRPSGKDSISFLGRVTFGDRSINILRKRTGAEIVFSVIHRYSLSRYELIMHNYEDMLGMLDASSGTSAGETVIKCLERYIYSYPEQWYAWKKYSQIKAFLPRRRRIEKPATSLALNPAWAGAHQKMEGAHLNHVGIADFSPSAPAVVK
jgi:lauroyl/myristoyl acyltransferase